MPGKTVNLKKKRIRKSLARDQLQCSLTDDGLAGESERNLEQGQTGVGG